MSRPAATMAKRYREGIGLILLALAAILLQRSATAPWMSGHGSDGARYEVSPIGLTRFDAPGAAGVACRWWPRLGDTDLCAIADAGSFVWLRRAYPFTVLALWTAVLALFLNALRVPRRRTTVRTVATAAVPALSLLALWCLFVAGPRALAAIAQMPVRPLAGGFGLMATATAMAGAAFALLVASRPGEPRLAVGDGSPSGAPVGHGL